MARIHKFIDGNTIIQTGAKDFFLIQCGIIGYRRNLHKVCNSRNTVFNRDIFVIENAVFINCISIIFHSIIGIGLPIRKCNRIARDRFFVILLYINIEVFVTGDSVVRITQSGPMLFNRIFGLIFDYKCIDCLTIFGRRRYICNMHLLVIIAIIINIGLVIRLNIQIEQIGRRQCCAVFHNHFDLIDFVVCPIQAQLRSGLRDLSAFFGLQGRVFRPVCIIPEVIA